MMTKKVCMLVTNPVSNDPRVTREAKTLMQAGYDVTVVGLAGPKDDLEDQLDGVRIIRIPKIELFTTGQMVAHVLKHGLPFLYVPVRAIVRLFYARQMRRSKQACGLAAGVTDPQTKGGVNDPPSRKTWLRKIRTDASTIRYLFWVNIEMAKRAVSLRVDCIHSHDLDTLLAGYIAKRKSKTVLVYDFHELYTEQFQPGEKTLLWRGWYSILERMLARTADYRLTVCDSLAEWLAERYNIPRATTVMNVPSVKATSDVVTGRSLQRVVLFHGGFSADRGLEGIIEAARELRGGKVVFRGFGPLEHKLRALSKQAGTEDVVSFASPVSMTDLVNAAAHADIGVVPYLPVCLNNRFCLPNKIFEYMMAGLAIVGSDLPELRRIILGHEIGLVYDPYNPKDLAKTLNELLADPNRLDQMRRNSLQAAQQRFNWAHEGQKLLKIYDQAMMRLAGV